jgi:HSP20 family protein
MIVNHTKTNFMKESPIYPGEYIPSPEVENLQQKLKLSHLGFTAKPLINLEETSSDIKIEVAIPGIKREDIFMYTQYNVLSIMIVGKKAGDETRKSEQIHEFDTECMERHILLPDHADTEFMSAEFRQGILYINIPKCAEEEAGLEGRQVIVY